MWVEICAWRAAALNMWAHVEEPTEMPQDVDLW